MRMLRIAVLCAGIAALRASAQPPFEFQNGRTATGLAFKVAGSGQGVTPWKKTLSLFGSGDGEQDTTKLVIAARRLETETGDWAELKVTQPAETKLAPGKSIEIEVSSELPAVGVYKSELILVQGGKQKVVPLQVTVAATTPIALPIQVYSAKAVASESSDDGKPIDMPIRIRNTGTEPLKLEVTLGTAARLDKVDNPTRELAIEAAALALKQTVVELQPGQMAPLELTLSGVTEPGLYRIETVLRELSGRFTATSVLTNVYRRTSWIVAALLIALGAGFTWIVRSFTTSGEQLLQARRRCALLSEQTQAFRKGAKTEKLMVAARTLELELDDRRRDLAWDGKAADLAPILDRVAQRLDLLQRIADAIERVDRLDADKQPGPRKVLDDALFVVRVDPGDATRIKTAAEAVQNLSVENLVRDQLRAQLEQLSDEVRRRELKSLYAKVDAAQLELQRDRFDETERAIEELRNHFADAMLEQLKRTPPKGMTEVDWKTASADLQGAALAGTAWAPRLAQLKTFERKYFEIAAAHLIKVANDKIAAGDSRKSALEAAKVELETALKAPDSNLGSAYERHAELVTSRDPQSASKGPINAPQPGVGEMILGPFAGFRTLAVPSAGRVESATTTSHAAQATLTQARVAVAFVVLLIAVATGLKVLWIDNLSWGGWESGLAAFLWGAGVQGTGDTFAGLINLRSRLGQ